MGVAPVLPQPGGVIPSPAPGDGPDGFSLGKTGPACGRGAVQDSSLGAISHWWRGDRVDDGYSTGRARLREAQTASIGALLHFTISSPHMPEHCHLVHLRVGQRLASVQRREAVRRLETSLLARRLGNLPLDPVLAAMKNRP